MKKRLAILLAVTIIILCAAWVYAVRNPDVSSINSFDDCVAAGYPVMESYPEQCNTPDGRNFVRDISN